MRVCCARRISIVKCRVMLVDDHAVFRETLAGGFASLPTVEVVAEEGSTTDCLQTLNAHPVDVLVLDLSLPGRGGADLVSQVSTRFPEVRVLILSAHPPDQFIVRLVQQGAAGYLHKSCSLGEVLDAVQLINEGKTVLPDELSAMLSKSGDADGLPHETLSNREYQVMERLVAGAGVSDIADEMNLSVKTISTYRKRLLEKLGVQSNSEVVSYAIHHGIVDM